MCTNLSRPVVLWKSVSDLHLVSRTPNQSLCYLQSTRTFRAAYSSTCYFNWCPELLFVPYNRCHGTVLAFPLVKKTKKLKEKKNPNPPKHSVKNFHISLSCY